MIEITRPNLGIRNLRLIPSSNRKQRVFGSNISNVQVNIISPKKFEERVTEPTNLEIQEDPQKCTEYAEEIESFMKSLEIQYMSKANYMRTQPDINEKMRAILTDWMVDVHLKFKLKENTLFLAINITDRFLEKERVTRQKLQLVGVTSIFIASKYEEIYPPEIKDFVYIADNAYGKSEIIDMEQRILNSLNYDLNLPSSYCFLQQFNKKLNPGMKVYNMSLYLIELSLIEYKFIKHKPSLCAASALYLSNRLINKDLEWDKKVGMEVGYMEHNIKQCAKELIAIIQAANNSTLSAVKRKFGMAEYMKVSSIRIGRKSQ